MEQDVRWIQRFENFKKAFRYLEKSAQTEKLDELQRDGLEHMLGVVFWECYTMLCAHFQVDEEPCADERVRQILNQAAHAGLLLDMPFWEELLHHFSDDDNTITARTYPHILPREATSYLPLFRKVIDDLEVTAALPA